MTDKPDDVIAYEDAIRRLREGRILEAVRLFEIAATTGEDRPMEHYALGCAYVKVGQLADAQRELQRFLEMEEEETAYVTAAKEALESLARRLAADEAREPPPDRRLAAVRKRFEVALGLIEEGQPDEAREVLESLRSDFPDSEEIHNLLGFLHLERGVYREAVHCFEQALKLNPFYAYAENNLGLALFRGGAAAALEHFESAMERDPECFEAYLNAGIALEQLGQHDEAIETWRRAAELRPGDAQIRRYLSRAGG